MPKRSRYNHVTFVDGKIQISASGITYTFDTINSWNMCETNYSVTNPQYALNVFSRSGDHQIACIDDNEMLSIAHELTGQGIGKRI
jgi:hypothetical protein